MCTVPGQSLALSNNGTAPWVIDSRGNMGVLERCCIRNTGRFNSVLELLKFKFCTPENEFIKVILKSSKRFKQGGNSQLVEF